MAGAGKAGCWRFFCFFFLCCCVAFFLNYNYFFSLGRLLSLAVGLVLSLLSRSGWIYKLMYFRLGFCRALLLRLPIDPL
jgi:hypothetical protein